jgi:AAA family ATP:ADP antiporter
MTNAISARTVATALAIGAAAMFLLCGYEFVRSASTSLYLEAYGSNRLAFVMFAVPFGTFAMLYVYGCILSWVGPRRALFITSILSGLGIAACYAAIRAGSHFATAILYVLREAYIVLLVEQYWSFINSTLRSGQARWLNGPICGIASLGAISGGFLVGGLAQKVGSEQLLLFAAASLVPAGLLAAFAFRFGGEPRPAETETHGGQLALRLFFGNRILIFLFLLIVCTQAVSTVLDLRFNGILAQAMPAKDARTAFSGNFFGVLNIAAFLMQFVATPLLLRFCSLRHVHTAIPLVHICACALLAAHPSLFTSGLAFLLFKTLDYSLFRAGKEVLYIPLSFDARYRAKQVIDAFGYRASKGAMSGLLAGAGKVFGRLPGATYPIIAMASAVAWLFLVLGLTRNPAQTAAHDKDIP